MQAISGGFQLSTSYSSLFLRTYLEPPTSERFGRSEGLAVASFHLFLEGAFSSQPETHPWRADGEF